MTTNDGLLVCIPGYLLLIPALPVAYWIAGRGADRRWTLLALLALTHVTATIALTIFPIPIGGQEYYRLTRGLTEDNAIPFATIVSQLTHPGFSSARQLIGNMLALAPLGIYAPGLWPAFRDPRKFVALAVAFAVGIELAQLAGSILEGFTYRVTDVDDALMNATGAISAFVIWRRLEGRPPVSEWLARIYSPAPDASGG